MPVILKTPVILKMHSSKKALSKNTILYSLLRSKIPSNL